MADACGEPDRRVAARGADLEHLAIHLRHDQCEEELPGRTRYRPGAFRGRQAPLTLVGVLSLQTLEHCANSIVEHDLTLERRLDLPLHLRADEAPCEMVVDDTARLHGRVDGRRADEAEPGMFQLFGKDG